VIESRKINYLALGVAFLFCGLIASLETLLGNEGLNNWYVELVKPSWHLQIWVFIVVAIIVYLINGFLVYRFCAVPMSIGNRLIGLTSLFVVMLYNALWNYALFETQDLLVGLLLLIAFLAPLLILQVVLITIDKKSAQIFGLYFAWVVMYDIPLYHKMWLLN